MQNDDLTLEFNENRVKVKVAPEAGKTFEVSQPKDGETLVHGKREAQLRNK